MAFISTHSKQTWRRIRVCLSSSFHPWYCAWSSGETSTRPPARTGTVHLWIQADHAEGYTGSKKSAWVKSKRPWAGEQNINLWRSYHTYCWVKLTVFATEKKLLEIHSNIHLRVTKILIRKKENGTWRGRREVKKKQGARWNEGKAVQRGT